MRYYDVPLQVRTAPEAADPVVDGEPLPPAQFLWHGRLYVVREVLARWRERAAWWAGAVGRGVHGDGATEPPAVPAERGNSLATVEQAPRPTGRPDQSSTLELRWDAADRWVWRVEASAGRSGVTGTYDLCREGPCGADAEAIWRLVRVSD